MVDIINRRFLQLSTTPSDIHEHLSTLKILARNSNSVIELGGRNGVSTWALLAGIQNCHGSDTLDE